MLNKIFIYFFLILIVSFNIKSEEKRIIIASSSSIYDSGFIDYINQEFENEYNIKIHVIPLGTGQAIEVAKRGDADVLIAHHKPSEIRFMNEGYGILRYEFMYNDYIIVGPKKNTYKCNSLSEFFKNILLNDLLFISRSDESGTYKKEKELWNQFNLKPDIYMKNYIKIGQGMGATLMITNEMKGYTLSDRATWISYNNKSNLKVICKNNPPLLNQYSIIAINPNLNKNIKFDWAKEYINWIIDRKRSKLINNFKINGEQLFYYNYKKKDPAS
jgi:ABC-type tungstate transport system, permease component